MRSAGMAGAGPRAARVMPAARRVVSDLRSMQLGRNAPPSDVHIRITPQDAWWRLDYRRHGVEFTTANEIHVPAGSAVSIEWPELPPPWIEGAACLQQDGHRCTLVIRS